MSTCCFVECPQFAFLCIFAYDGTDNMKQVACLMNNGALLVGTKNPLFFVNFKHCSNIQLISLIIAVCSFSLH